MRVIIDGRVFERVEGELAVRYSSQGSDKEVSTTTKNISGGGVMMPLLQRLDPGTVLDLEIFRTCPKTSDENRAYLRRGEARSEDAGAVNALRQGLTTQPQPGADKRIPSEGFGAGSIYNTDIKVKCRGKIVWIWDKSIDEEDERFFEAGVQFIDWRLLSIGGLIGWLKESKREISKI